ncbi:hypothetical protein [Pseudomonas sp. EA_35y_Pfl2_R5]|uniref:hypothetical protein n=1 Tax=Pseudomonas sp. EA_35y_Pfl2_R5 TaxID=3088690 RepID=UPI0030DB45E9
MPRRLLLLLPLLITGCSSPSYFEAVQPSSPQQAVLYLYRPEASNPGLMQPLRYDYPEVFIDGQSIGTLKFNSHRHVELAPGKHSVRITGLSPAAKWEPRDIEQSLTLKPAQITYLKLNVQYQLDEMVLGQPGPRYNIRLTPMRSEDAIYEIRHTKPQ